ncbi:hypothetical protein N184_32605 [Sinorhizobium sp. GL28]|nr:hypothetical protein N184_32605 [Sinorhizobium sp. GL28]
MMRLLAALIVTMAMRAPASTPLMTDERQDTHRLHLGNINDDHDIGEE